MKVTVLMPVMRGIEYLEETLQSVQGQTVADWELLAVYAPDLDEENLEILQSYAEKDNRILLHRSEEWANQAEMLNLGLENAQGEYVARAEVGAVFVADRLEKQLAFLEAHPEVSFCSSSVNMVNTEGRSSLRKAICDGAELRASMIFGCEINHQSVMLRKADFDNKNLRYDPEWLSEYELWGRAMLEGLLMANLPEALVSCYAQSNGMDMGTRERLHAETRQLVMRNISALCIDIADYSPTLFAGWRNRPEGFAKKHPVNFLKRGYLLLQEMAEANNEKKMFDDSALEKVLFKRWDWIRKSCGLDFVAGQYGKFAEVREPKVSIVMPVGKCAGTLSRAIDSLQAQTLNEWELFLMQVAGQEDGSSEIAAMYAKNDPRISYLPMEEERNEAEAMNEGFGMATGKYIARMAADVVAVPERLEKQSAYLDEHEEVVICGGWQRINDAHGEQIQKTADDNDVLKARLMFYEDMIPETLMLRKELLKDGLAYDTEAQDIDYVFLAKASLCGDVANLPMVLVTREGSSNTQKNLALAAEESGKVAAQVLEQALGVSVSHSSQKLLNDWVNPLGKEQDWKREQEISRFSSILQDIWRANEEKQYYAPKALLDVLARKWCQVRHDIDWQHLDTSHIENLEEIFADAFKPQLTMPYHIFRKEKEAGERRIPKVTALMPLFNGKKYIRESIESIQAQTFTDWEFYIVNDFGSDDGCADIIKDYAMQDERIVLVQAERRLGLAASLNLGLDLIKSEYVARVDADDPSEPERFAEQVSFMDSNTDISVCSSYCMSMSPNSTNFEDVPCEPEYLRATLFFPNDIRHFLVMLRRDDFEKHSLRYEADCIVEDYELWTRASMLGLKFANIPKVLATHRWGYGNISIAKGSSLETISGGISQRILGEIGVQTDKYMPELFYGWRAYAKKKAQSNKRDFLKQGYSLIKEIYRYGLAHADESSLKRMLYRRWDWIRQSCGLGFAPFLDESFMSIKTTPMVSVVLPVYRSLGDVCKVVDSIRAQSFTDWELLVINDGGNDDGTVELVSMYAWADPRIKLVQADHYLGTEESFNLGMRKAKGKYLALLDCKSIPVPERLEKQFAFLEDNPQVGILGGWQRYNGKSEWIHSPAAEPQRLRARLLFWCEFATTTVMFKRELFLEHELFFDDNAQDKAFDLWTRAIEHMEVANIPEVLGDCRENKGLSKDEVEERAEESGKIVARTLRKIMGIRLSPYEYRFLCAYKNKLSKNNREEELFLVREIIRKIWKRNEEVNAFTVEFLLEALVGKYFWLKDKIDWKKVDYRNLASFDEIFSEGKDEKIKIIPHDYNEIENLLPQIDKMVEHWTWERYQRMQKDLLPKIDKMVEKWTWERYQRMQKGLLPKIDKIMEKWTWERYRRLQVDRCVKESPWVPYYSGSKIRVAFIFQIASFWPAQEYLYKAMLSDARFDVRLVCYDEYIDNTIKTETARSYLEDNGYDFVDWKKFSLDDFNPHIVFVQTQYDSNRRADFDRQNLLQKGHRVVFISYGLEIGNTIHARNDQFKKPILASWRIYTLSETMRQDYLYYSKNPHIAKALGMPRFDALYHKEQFPQHKEIVERAMGRKVVLWKAHFPKIITQLNEKILVTPDIREYVKFAHMLSKEYSDFFFVFMPHPRFYEFNEDDNVRMAIRELMGILSESDNVYIDEDDDYRPSLLNADAIIVDRSAVMIEAAVVDVPLLYMSNADFYEPMTEAVRPLVESYEQGTNCQDMVEFMERFRQGIDKNKEQRNHAFKQCIPYFDGKCSERIKEDIVASLEREIAEIDM